MKKSLLAPAAVLATSMVASPVPADGTTSTSASLMNNLNSPEGITVVQGPAAQVGVETCNTEEEYSDCYGVQVTASASSGSNEHDILGYYRRGDGEMSTGIFGYRDSYGYGLEVDNSYPAFSTGIGDILPGFNFQVYNSDTAPAAISASIRAGMKWNIGDGKVSASFFHREPITDEATRVNGFSASVNYPWDNKIKFFAKGVLRNTENGNDNTASVGVKYSF